MYIYYVNTNFYCGCDRSLPSTDFKALVIINGMSLKVIMLVFILKPNGQDVNNTGPEALPVSVFFNTT